MIGLIVACCPVKDGGDECDSVTCVSHRAAYSGDLKSLQTLLEAGVLSLDHYDQLGSTLLHKGTPRVR